MSKTKSNIIFILTMAIAIAPFLFLSSANALDVTLAWNPSSGATGYKIYYDSFDSPSGPPYNGTGIDEGASPIEVENGTGATLHNLDAGGYRFALTAYNEYGESGYSVEVCLLPFETATRYTLSATHTAGGTVTPNGGVYPDGDVVRLTAMPDPDWVFSGWSGDIQSSTNPTAIIIDSNKFITANFIRLPGLFTLTVNALGNGSVNPSEGKYGDGSKITLSAVPEEGWEFKDWSGDLVGSSNPAAVTMNSNKHILAMFREVSMASQASPVITGFGITSGTILKDETGFLVWNITQADSATIDNGIGPVDPITGSKEVSPGSTTTYTLTASNSYGSETATATLTVGKQILEVIPHNGAGLQDNVRVAHDTSFAVHIVDAAGIDITDPDSVQFIVKEGGLFESTRDLDDTGIVTVTKLLDEGDAHATDLWVAYHRAAEPWAKRYPFDTEIRVQVNIKSANDEQVFKTTYAFRTETKAEHDEAEADSPNSSILPPSGITIEGFDAGIQITDGELSGAKIIYADNGPVIPRFGPTSEMPSLGVEGVFGVGVPVNLQPPTVFIQPATLFIPCPGYSDVSDLSVYLFNGVEWVLACDAEGNVLTGGEGWMVPGSRIDHHGVDTAAIEIQAYYSSGAWAASDVPRDEGPDWESELELFLKKFGNIRWGTPF